MLVSDSAVMSHTLPSTSTSFPLAANPVPVMVISVPPPVPPRWGETAET